MKQNRFLIWLKQILINFLVLISKKIKISVLIVKKADKNDDGYISLQEMLEPFKKYKVIIKIINFLNATSIIGVPVDKVLALDTDEDGSISIKELWSYIKNFNKNLNKK